jgi:8-oxo-dGTP pyrophosphatase MutT (NUDIX family)
VKLTVDRDSLRDALSRHAPQAATEVIPGLARKDAGVLVPIALGPRPAVLLTARSTALRDHGGELCFPGGKPDANDRDLAATALREAHEEIGLAPSHVELVGRLTPVPTATSAYRLNPFVALVERAPEWVLSSEVARVVEVPLDALASGEVAFCLTTFAWRGDEHPTPFFEVDAHTVIYGATAHVLWELVSALAPVGLSLPEPRMVPQPAWAGPLVERFLALEARAARG